MAVDKTIDGLQTARDAREALGDKKALDLVLLDVRGVSQVTDYILMATATSTPHLKALSDEVQRVLKKNRGLHCYRKAGDKDGGWIVLDYIDVIIHVFSTQAREYYAIEELWPEAPRIPLR